VETRKGGEKELQLKKKFLREELEKMITPIHARKENGICPKKGKP